MRIGGLQKCSLIDYPGKVSCVIFTQGCNFRCPYCHNRELVLPEHFQDPVPERAVLNFLERRAGYLDGVVISGGEPTQQSDLLLFMEIIKKMGFRLKLDTNGSRPQVIRKIIDARLADFIAMDIKTSFERYPQAAGIKFPVHLIKQSIELIRRSEIPHQFRTTVVPAFCNREDVRLIRSHLKEDPSYRLQPFKESPKMIDPNLSHAESVPWHEIETW